MTSPPPTAKARQWLEATLTSQETRTLPSRRQVLVSASSKRGEDDLDAAMLKVEATKSRFASSPRFVARARPLARTVARKLPSQA